MNGGRVLPSAREPELPDGFWYAVKRRMLGPPLVTEQLTNEAGWRRRLVINAACGGYTALVVVLFAVVKFTEGAWLIVILFPLLVYALIRLNRQYRKEAAILQDLSGSDLQPHPPNLPRRVVLLLVDSYDLATIAVIQYARSLRPTALRAVHFAGIEPGRRIRRGMVGVGADGRPAMINPRYELLG